MDLINKCLTKEPSKRISAVQALDHAWIKTKVTTKIDTKAQTEAFKNLHAFRVHFRLN
jgi:serine/threonine protein kinase